MVELNNPANLLAEDFDLDTLVKKAGGKFRFVTLVQRRMRELQNGSLPLVESPVQMNSLMRTAIEEYRQGKIWCLEGEEAREAGEALAENA